MVKARTNSEYGVGPSTYSGLFPSKPSCDLTAFSDATSVPTVRQNRGKFA